MLANGYFIDANLLLLLVVSSVSRDAISKHRRLREFTPDDYFLTEDTPVVTVDFDLYFTAASSNPESAINFTHLRDL